MSYPDPYAFNRIHDEAEDSHRRAGWQQRGDRPYTAAVVLAVVAGLLIVAVAAL